MMILCRKKEEVVFFYFFIVSVAVLSIILIVTTLTHEQNHSKEDSVPLVSGGIKADRIPILTQHLVEDYARFKGMPIHNCASDPCILFAAKGLYNAAAPTFKRETFSNVYRAAVKELVWVRSVYLTAPYLG